ncbi:MAG: S41 family peptidase [Candidatus Gracilibacteria bacterium]|nr:S41 family peptidase [Candidatus Gracilibacteria bacterium]
MKILEKRKLASLLVTGAIFLNINSTLAQTVKINNGEGNVQIINIKVTPIDLKKKEVSREEAFTFMAEYTKEIPTSYKYINLNFKGIDKDEKIYDSLQRLVYIDAIRNMKVDLNLDEKINIYDFFILIRKVTGENFLIGNDPEKLKNLTLNAYDVKRVKNHLELLDFSRSNDEIKQKELDNNEHYLILKDVYETLKNKFLWKDDLDKEEMFAHAAQGLAEATGDKHTAYLLPEGDEALFNSLNNSFAGVGAYLKQRNSGEFMIDGVIEEGPSDKAGLIAGDIIVEIDGKDVGDIENTKGLLPLLRGEIGSEVVLRVKRGARILDIKIIRGVIQLDNVTGAKIEDKDNTYYVKVRAFGTNTFSGFKEQIKEIKKDNTIKNIIFDLRGNPGGIVGEAQHMLNYFYQKGELIYNVNGANNDKDKIHSTGILDNEKENYEIDFSDYQIYILVDGDTASAAEMFTAGVKNKFPDTKIIGEKSYGKASMQALRNYRDGSLLKYTIAVWTIGENEIKINGVGITPDLEVEFDAEKYKNEDIDTQLKAVLDEIN